MKRLFLFLIIAVTAFTLCSCSGGGDIIELSDPFHEKPMLSVNNEYLLNAIDVNALLEEYVGITLKCDGIEYEVTNNGSSLVIAEGETVFEGEEANALIDRLLPKVFEKDTSLQLETNMLDDGTGEAIIYLFIDDMVMNAFPNEELTENEIFSVYYELDEDGRAVSVTYSKAVDRENFKILQMVTITY